jgi:hypothetical protein
MKTIAVVLAGVLLSSSVYGQTINACYNKKTGDLRISNSCKKMESPISWGQSIQGPKGEKGDPGSPGKSIVGAQGLQGATGSAGYTGPSAIDGTGQNIGILVSLSSGSNFVIFNPTLGAFFTLGIDIANQQVLIPHVDLFTESEDCTGQKYLDQNKMGDPLFSQSVYLGEDGLYYAQNGRVQTVKIASIISRQSPFSISPICVRLCGFYPYPCTNHTDFTTCNYGPYTIYGERIETGCPPPDASIGPDSNPQWITQDKSVIPVQEVSIPFTTPITLPLSFR